MTGPEPDELIEAYLAGELDEEGRARLRAQLLGDRERLRAYVRAARFDQDLAALVRARAQRHEHGYQSTRFERGTVLPGPRRWARVVAVAALIALAIGGWLAWSLVDTRGVAEHVAGIVLADVSGQVRMQRVGSPAPAAVAGLELRTGDTLIAEGEARATARFADGTLVTLRRGSLALGGAAGKHLALAGGVATVRAAKQPPGQMLVIETPRARAEVVGTVFTIADDAALTTLAVSEGTVAFVDRRSGERRAIPAGQRAIAGPDAVAARRGAPPGQRPADPYLGVELGAVADTAPEFIFVDQMRQAVRFLPVSTPEHPDPRDPGFTLRPDGWLASLSPGRHVATVMGYGDGGHVPAGLYTCLYAGTGSIEFGGDAAVVASEPGRLVVRVRPTAHGSIMMAIAAADAADPPREINLIAPGFEATWREHPFHPAYLARWRGCGVIRAEAWEDASLDDQPLSWAQRAAPESGPRAQGVPAEFLLALGAELDADVWLTVPVEADDSYVAGLAALAHRGLGEHRRLYVEYGHGVWDEGDSNSQWVKARGIERGHAPEVALERAYVDRALEVFAAWTREFGDDPRLVRVLNFGGAEGAELERRLTWRDAAAHADALALALGFGRRLDPAIAEVDDFAARANAAMRADVDAKLALAASLRPIARAHGLRLIGYGAGPDPHFAGPVSLAAHQRLLQIVDTPEVAALLGDLIRGWRERVGDLLCCDLPNQLFQLKSRSPVGELPTGEEVETYRALLDLLPPPAP